MLWVWSTTMSQPFACLHSFTARVSLFASSFLWTLADSKWTSRPCSQEHDACRTCDMFCHVCKLGCQATTLSSSLLLHLFYDCCYINVILSSANLYFTYGQTLWTIFHKVYITRIPLCWSTPLLFILLLILTIDVQCFWSLDLWSMTCPLYHWCYMSQ